MSNRAEQLQLERGERILGARDEGTGRVLRRRLIIAACADLQQRSERLMLVKVLIIWAGARRRAGRSATQGTIEDLNPQRLPSRAAR